MEVLINLDPEQERLIVAEGDPCEYISALVAKECKRLWHIERCKPRERGKLPPGPRRLTVVEKEVRDKGDFLRTIYVKLREHFGEEYPEFLQRQEADLEAAIEQQDLTALVKILQEQPWQRRS